MHNRLHEAVGTSRTRTVLGLLRAGMMLAVVLVLIAVLMPAAQAQEEGKRLVWSSEFALACLDPAFQRRLPDWNIMMNTHSSLLTHKPGSLTEVTPDLAESWTVSDDGLVYTFSLRQGVQWHEGYGEVTAEDVKYSWERQLDPDTGATSNSDLQIVESIEVLDPYTLQVTLRQPSAPFITVIANSAYTLVVNQRAVEERGEEHCVRPIGSGPYRVVEAEVGGGVLLEAVDYDHHLGRPAIQFIEYRFIPEESVSVLGLLNGDLDMIFVRDYANKARLANEPGFQLNVNIGFENSTYMASLNNEKPPFDDVRVRRALVLGTDRATFATALTEGMVNAPAHSFVPPSMLGYTDDVTQYPYDPEEARRLLAEAGYPDGFSTSIQLISRSYHPRAATMLQEMWREIGVDVEVELLELAAVRAAQRSGEMNITLGNLSVVDPHQSLYAQFHSDNVGAGNYTRYNNPELDALIQAQVSEMDPEARTEIILQAQRLLADEVPAVPLLHMLTATAAHDGVSGLIPDAGWWRTHFYWMDIE